MEMISELENWPHVAPQMEIKKGLKQMFQKYNTLEESQRRRLDQLLIRHKEYCLREGNEQYIRQHNSFCHHYIGGVSIRNIAREQAITIRAVPKGINAVLDRLLILLLGFYGIRWDVKNKAHY